MNIYDAIKLLEDKSIVLKNKTGEIFQRENNYHIWRDYSEETKPSECSLGGTIKNIEFIKEYIDDEFENVPQWSDDIKFPILCNIRDDGWTKYKLIELKSRSGNMLQTGFGESYFLQRQTKIYPITKEECIERFYTDEVQNGRA